MSKPLFRFTVGGCLQQGLDVLAESIHRTTKALGLDMFDWVICYNGLNRDNLQFLQRAIGDLPILLHNQDWATCPINDNCQTPRRRDGSYEINGNRCGGTMWKTCPPRMRLDAHEIVMDNDVVLLKKFHQIDPWLKQTQAVLLLEEPVRFYGRYDHLFGPNQPYLNSGFMGFPPGYDFGYAIFQNWSQQGRLMNLSQADEQGLLVYTLSQQPSIRIHLHQMVELLHSDRASKVDGKVEAYHFTQANRAPNHTPWKKYKELKL